jgi:GntR family transcriptional regulator/MocR family aminotransferase
MGQLSLSTLPINLDRGSALPLYQQVQRQISQFILGAKLAPGTRLPAGRDLAIRLGVNRATVANAYDGLASEGLVRSHVGQGTFVLDSAEPQHAKTLTWPISRAMEAAGRHLLSETPPSEHPDPIDFASLIPDEELFPIEPFRKTVNAVLRSQGKRLLQYGAVPGYPPLRRYIAERLAERKVQATPEQVLIVNGSQQGLDLVFRALVNPGDTVVVESPTYTAVLPVLAQYQARVVGIPMTERGMDRQALEAALASRPVRLIYTMPTFHNPTGITMDLASRRTLLNLAGRYGVPIVEDDFDSELRFHGEALPPIKALDVGGSVLYLGTFSKGLFPGLRLGWIVAPPELVGVLGRAKMFTDYHTSQLLQAAVLEFCERGHYKDHLRNLARVNGKKSQLLVKAMVDYFPEGVSWTEPEGGYAFWVTLPRHLSSEILLAEAARGGVLFSPGSQFFTNGEGQQFLRLSISRVPTDRIEEGAQRLGKLIERYITKEPQQSPQSAGEPVFHI